MMELGSPDTLTRLCNLFFVFFMVVIKPLLVLKNVDNRGL